MNPIAIRPGISIQALMAGATVKCADDVLVGQREKHVGCVRHSYSKSHRAGCRVELGENLAVAQIGPS